MASAFCVLSKKSFLHFKFINFLLYVFLSFISLSFMQLKFYYQKFNFSYTKTKVLYLQLLCQGLRITFILITYPTFLFMKEIQHCQLSDAPFIRHHLFPWNSFDTLLKIQLTIYMWVSCILCSFPSIYSLFLHQYHTILITVVL